jgi:hypothetical protein
VAVRAPPRPDPGPGREPATRPEPGVVGRTHETEVRDGVVATGLVGPGSRPREARGRGPRRFGGPARGESARALWVKRCKDGTQTPVMIGHSGTGSGSPIASHSPRRGRGRLVPEALPVPGWARRTDGTPGSSRRGIGPRG